MAISIIKKEAKKACATKMKIRREEMEIAAQVMLMQQLAREAAEPYKEQNELLKKLVEQLEQTIEIYKEKLK